MRRAVSLLLAIVAMLVPAASAIAAPMRDAARVELGAENRVKAILPSGVVEAEGHTLFLQRDPNGYQDSVNQYAYAANDPVNRRDPTGRGSVDGKYCEWAPAIGSDVASCWDLGATKLAGAIGGLWDEYVSPTAPGRAAESVVGTIDDAVEVERDVLGNRLVQRAQAVRGSRPGSEFVASEGYIKNKGVDAASGAVKSAAGAGTFAFRIAIKLEKMALKKGLNPELVRMRKQLPADTTFPSEAAARREALRRRGVPTSVGNNFEREAVWGKNPNLVGADGEPYEILHTRDANGRPVQILHHANGHVFEPELQDDGTFELPHYEGPQGEHLSYPSELLDE